MGILREITQHRHKVAYKSLCHALIGLVVYLLILCATCMLDCHQNEWFYDGYCESESKIHKPLLSFCALYPQLRRSC